NEDSLHTIVGDRNGEVVMPAVASLWFPAPQTALLLARRHRQAKPSRLQFRYPQKKKSTNPSAGGPTPRQFANCYKLVLLPSLVSALGTTPVDRWSTKRIGRR